MDLDNTNEDLLIITPNAIKLKLLSKTKSLKNIKYMTKEEFKNEYYFSYDNKTIDYLITKYHFNIDICRVYLNNLYVIDLDKKYKNPKLIFLQDLKRELDNNNLLYYNKLFRESIKNKKIIVYKYNLEKYEKELFKNIYQEDKKLNKKLVVYSCNSLEDEILFVIEKITELINKGISLNNIYITNLLDSDLYSVNRLFKYFNIPLNIDMKESIYGTKLVKNYLKTNKISINNDITKKIVNTVNSLIDVKDSPNYQEFLIDKLKHTNLSQTTYKEAVTVVKINELELDSNDYLFIMGFNQEILPKTYKDEDYLSDNVKDEVCLYTTLEKNKYEKERVTKLLKSIDNLYLSYRKRDNFNTYFKSSLITDLGIEEREYSSNKVYNSNMYNKLLLGQMLDNYFKYGENNPNLESLYNTYDKTYNTYTNIFTGISNEKFLAYINNYLKLSYTSINTFNKCSFRYYLNYILKLNTSSNDFSLFIGNLFHYILENMDREDFSFEELFDNYLEKRELSLSELLFIKDLKKILLEDIEIIKKQKYLTTYKDSLKEKEITLKLDKKIDVDFTGKIDKIMYKENINDTYYSLIDYKTGYVNTSLNNIKYGLDMQLAIYLYLLNKSNLFTNPIFTGIYFERVLTPSIKWEKNIDIDKVKNDNLKLSGYSTDDVDRLYEFDKSYEDSDLIKSMKVKNDSSFYNYVKLLSDDDIYNLVKYTEKEINMATDKIINSKFEINPKVIEKTKSCDNCEFRDICFVNNKDYIYLDKVDNLDFLEGDISANN